MIDNDLVDSLPQSNNNKKIKKSSWLMSYNDIIKWLVGVDMLVIK